MITFHFRFLLSMTINTFNVHNQMSKEKNKKIYVKFENKLFINLQKYLLQNRLEQFAYLFCHTSTSDSDIIVLPKKIVIF